MGNRGGLAYALRRCLHSRRDAAAEFPSLSLAAKCARIPEIVSGLSRKARGARHVVDIYVEYEGELHCRAEHGPSKSVLVTDAPVDNHGRGESFSATDLVATGL